MSLYLLLYLFLLSVFLTLTFTLIFGNRGPWNNPMMFFLVHFLTSWSIVLWSDPVTLKGISYPYITGAVIAIIMAFFLAATKTMKGNLEKIRRLKDNQLVDVMVNPGGKPARIMPNWFFWGLVLFESLIIMGAYLLKYLLIK
jgi:hypothetical protein